MIAGSLSIFGFDLFGLMPWTTRDKDDASQDVLEADDLTQEARDSAARSPKPVRDPHDHESFYWLQYPIY